MLLMVLGVRLLLSKREFVQDFTQSVAKVKIGGRCLVLIICLDHW